MNKIYTPEEADAKYRAEWVVLNAKKEAAKTSGNVHAVKKYRQELSRISSLYSARHKLKEPQPYCLSCAAAQYRIEFLEGVLAEIAQAGFFDNDRFDSPTGFVRWAQRRAHEALG